jgi:hypothetical protein
MEHPKYLKRQIVLYSLPMLLVSAHLERPAAFVLSIPSAILPYFIYGTRAKMHLSNLLFILYLFHPSLYFVCYGFTLSSTYISLSNLCLDSLQDGNVQLGFVLEAMGVFASFYYRRSLVVSFGLGLLQFLNIHFLLSPPPMESADCGEAYLKLLRLFEGAPYKDRAKEYKKIISKTKKRLPRKMDFFLPLIMSDGSLLYKIVLCCSAMMGGHKIYYMGFIAYSLLIMRHELLSAILAFFSSFSPGEPVFRLVSIQFLYLIILGSALPGA